ncbi:acyl-CoA desaturase [Pseudoflavitalea sp. X16]|uniref:fatty acid desaturase family protein n=1 Tax=Paraflavitalea devenefica TaxID=2716334 RepID=UPI001423DE96|nr:acyl-CoA desaturase [Paraflavitalea devenefica]NII26723.1 acyl-CoA desaturase [Paraflavitalea devenefica]
MPKVTYNNKSKPFYQTIKSGVDQYFASMRLKPTGNWKLYSKSVVLITSAAVLYLSLLLFPLPVGVSIALCALLGFVLASIGFNVMHDACHGSYSSRKWINNVMGLTLNALGGNAFIWKFKHNIIHHTYTNVDGVDDDINKSPLMRMCATQKWVPAHRFQHIYVVPIYAISSLAWVLLLDFDKYFKRKVVDTPLQKMDRKEHFIFWISKVLYVLFYILLPALVVGWVPWLIGFICMHAAMGITLAIVFQLAHVVEDTAFEHVEVNDQLQIENEWAIHQVITTANFARTNKIVSWFTGGLNFQVEHHLFPRISHVHYPAISIIVKQACQQYNIAYNEFPTMRQAVLSHFRTMKQLGRKPV